LALARQMALTSPAQCAKHPETPATDTCGRCGRFACNACLATSDDFSRCTECVGREGGGVEVPPPWEQRSELGLLASYVATVKLALLEPAKFWSQLPKNGPLGDAFWFGWLTTIIASIPTGAFLLLNLGQTFALVKALPNMPAEMTKVMSYIEAHTLAAGALFSLYMIVIYPIGLVISAGLMHLFLRLWGAGQSGFDATFRVQAYAAFPSLVAWIPLIGGLAGIYQLVMVCWGFVKIHRTSTGRVVGAVLTPGVVLMCCFCGIGAVTALAFTGRPAH
jgi:hypothetical protein